MVNGVARHREPPRSRRTTCTSRTRFRRRRSPSAGVSAEFGRFGGGVVNVITKSGGNLFTGSFRDTLNNDNWRDADAVRGDRSIAADPAAQGHRASPRSCRRTEYTFGGPILKDKLWFFTAGRLTVAGERPHARRDEHPVHLHRRRASATRSRSPTRRRRTTGSRGTTSKISADAEELHVQHADVDGPARALAIGELPAEPAHASTTTACCRTGSSSKAAVSGRRLQPSTTTARQSTDLIKGTLLLDQSTRGTRTGRTTFCGVCGPEKRNNDDFFVKGVVLPVDEGQRFAQHVVRLRQLQRHPATRTTTSRAATTASWARRRSSCRAATSSRSSWATTRRSSSTTRCRSLSQGTNFRTHSAFFNDAWRMNGNLTANLGLRWDKNHGVDQAGQPHGERQRLEPARRHRLGSDGQGRVGGHGQLRQVHRRHRESDRRLGVGRRQPADLQWVYHGPEHQRRLRADSRRRLTRFSRCSTGSTPTAGIGTALRCQPRRFPGVTPTDSTARSTRRTTSSTRAASAASSASRAAIRADFDVSQLPRFLRRRASTRRPARVTNSFGQPFDLALVENDTNGL